MSGSNPFRRRRTGADSISQFPRERETGGNPLALGADNTSNFTTTSGQQHVSDLPTRSAPRSQKTVRIASPPVPSSGPPAVSSTPSDRYATFEGQPRAHRGSPPPPGPSGDTDSADPGNEDPFRQEPDTSGSEEEESSVDVESSIEWNTQTGTVWTGVTGSRQGPEQQSQHRRAHSSSAAATTTPQPADALRSKRTTLDVDAFKRLLLTGDPGTGLGLGPSTTPVVGHAQTRSEGSADAIPSSHRTDVPQTQHDSVAAIASLESGLHPATPRTGTGEKKKPPPPKTRRGKLIRSSDEAESTTSAQLSSTSPPIPRPGQSDSNSSPSAQSERPSKPLPRTPRETSTTPTTTSAVSTDSTQTSSSNPSQSKRPPTPPLTRRHSQMKPNQAGVSRSNSARLPVNTSTLNTSNLARRASMPKTPPPPPSPRRHDLESTTSASPSTSTPSGHRSSSLITPPKPPPESPNNTSPESSSLHRSGSVSKRRTSGSLSRQSSTSNVPPRPPPPRRSGGTASNRASLDDSRPVITVSTGALASSNNSTTGGTTEPLPAPSHASDILADLSRLQQEVDSLRVQYEKRSPG
ncbi:hypothetical protein VTO42DRAFT_2278 [Malbranchea cinnamomea]